MADGSTTEETVTYSPRAQVLRGIPSTNRSLTFRDFSWLEYEDAKYKLSEFRQWRTNPFADFSLEKLRRVERALDRVTGRTTSKPGSPHPVGAAGRASPGAGSTPARRERGGLPGEETPDTIEGGEPCGRSPIVSTAAVGKGPVSNEEAKRTADAFCGAPVDSPTSRAYCRPSGRPFISAVDEALRRSMLVVSPRDAVSDISVEYGLDDAAQESVLDEVNEQLDDARRMGRLVHL